MTLSIVDFLRERIEEDCILAQAAIDDLYGPDDCYFDTSNRHIVDHYLRHEPERVLREVAAKRRIMERHSRYDDTNRFLDYCAGCPSGNDDGYPDTELKDCPELQDLAFTWNEHEDWDTAWCPHVEGRHEADVTEVPPARGCYTNACNRCGAGDGWHYRMRQQARESG